MKPQDSGKETKPPPGKIAAWSEQLPIIQPPLGNNMFVLDGFLLRAVDNQIRFVTGHLCLEFDPADIVAVEELPLTEGIRMGIAVPARLSLRAGASLLGVYSSEPYRDLLCTGRKPFVFATRTNPCEVAASNRFHQLEEEFLDQYNLRS